MGKYGKDIGFIQWEVAADTNLTDNILKPLSYLSLTQPDLFRSYILTNISSFHTMYKCITHRENIVSLLAHTQT